MTRWTRTVLAVATAGVTLLVAACGQSENEAAPTVAPTPSNVATPAAPGDAPSTPAPEAPNASDGAETTTSPTGEPSSSFWTDEKLQQVQPENMPTEP
jgi:hypothetical protein